MDKKFTPGPWTCVTWSDAMQVRAIDSKKIILHKSDHFLTDEDKANARLIATAPKLLDEVEQTIAALEDFSIKIVAEDMIVPLWVNERLEYLRAVMQEALEAS